MFKQTTKKTIILLISILAFSFFCANLSASPKGDSEKIQKLIKKGKIDEAKKIFQAKVDINEMDSKGNTALHTAALVNDPDLVRFLLFKGANPDLKNFDGDTPLHIAIKNDCKDCAYLLSAEKSNIFSRDGNGKTALQVALEKGERYYGIVINQNTGNLLDENNRNLVHYVIETENETALRYCIKNNIPLSYIDVDGYTPLKLAYKKNSEKGITLASMLLMAGCTPERSEYGYFEDCMKTRNVSIRFDDGQTPLHYAAIYGHTAIAEYLLKNGASTQAKDILGSTPLHEAVRYGNTAIVKLLLKNKANPNSLDSLGTVFIRHSSRRTDGSCFLKVPELQFLLQYHPLLRVLLLVLQYS